MNDQIRIIRECLAGMNWTQEEARKRWRPSMNPSRFSFILNEERRNMELDDLERFVVEQYNIHMKRGEHESN